MSLRFVKIGGAIINPDNVTHIKYNGGGISRFHFTSGKYADITVTPETAAELLTQVPS